MCLVLLPNVHRHLMAAALTMTQCRLQALLALVRLPCSEPPPASLFLTWLCTEMFFSLSALGRDWSCYPSQSMSVNFLVPRGLSTSGSAWEVALVTLSARLHNHSSGTLLPRRPAPRQGLLWLSPAPHSTEKTPQLHHRDLTGKAICLLRASLLFLAWLEEAVAV